MGYKILMILGSGREPQLTGSHGIVKAKSTYTYNHSAPVQHSVFSLSLPYMIKHMRRSTLYYIIGLVLSDFAQLEANVSVLSMVKVG